MDTSRHMILAPTDMSEASGRAVAHAVELGHRLGVGVLLYHVLSQQQVDERLDAGEFIDVQLDRARDELERWYRTLLPRAVREPVRVELHIAIGAPVEEILELADDRHVEMIVMATHGRTGLPRVLFGSVAEGVLRHAPCPVVTLRMSPQLAHA